MHRDLNFRFLRNEATEIMDCGFQTEGNIKMEAAIKSCNFVCVYCQCLSSPGIEACAGFYAQDD